MRNRMLVCPVALALLLGIVAVACGGGASATATPPPSPTSAPTATVAATATERPTQPSASPESADAGSGQGGISSHDATPVGTSTSGATPTVHQATYVATPHRLPTQPPVIVEATATTAEDSATAASTEEGSPASGDVQIVVDQDFSTGDPGPFYIGGEEGETSYAMAEGQYTITPPDGFYSTSTIVDLDLADGAIQTDASVSGQGAAGVVGRFSTGDDGTFTTYICWINSDGEAGCHSDVSDQWTELFRATADQIQLQPTNTLFLAVVGDQLMFAVNDTIVGTITDESIASGSWGFYSESFSGNAATAAFNNVTIAQVPPDFLTTGE